MFTTSLALTLASVAATASANCLYGTSHHRRAENGVVEVSNFGYSGEQGPLNWAAIDPANSACSTGKVQSPIVLDDTIQKAASAPVVNIASVEEAEFENLGTTLEVVVTGTTTFEGVDYTLQQFHLHTPSEHRINDEYYPLEMHMVHEAADGSIAVIAVPFDLTEDGSTTELLSSVITDIGAVATPGTVTKTGALDFAPLVNAIQTTPLFQYTGSLTTPPCAEGLTFLVVSEPLPLNVATYNALKRTIRFNSRYTQNVLDKANLIEVASLLSATLNPLVCEASASSLVAPVVEHISSAPAVEHTPAPVVVEHTSAPVVEHVPAPSHIPVAEEIMNSSHDAVTEQCNKLCQHKRSLHHIHARHHHSH